MTTDQQTYPKILIAAPVAADMKAYCIWEWVEYVKNLSYPNYDVLLIDNSEDDQMQHKLREQGISVVRQPPEGRYFRELLAEAWNIIRRVAMKKGYAFHLCLETDVFGNYNIIERLLADAYAYQLHAVGFSYCLGHGEDSSLMAFDWHKTLNGWDAKNCTPISGFHQLDGKLKTTFNVGQGCLLLNTLVYRHIQYRYTTEASPDTYLAKDLWANEIPVYVDTSVLMNHKNRNNERHATSLSRQF